MWFGCSAATGACERRSGGSEGSKGQSGQAEEELLSEPDTYRAAKAADTYGQRLLRPAAGVTRRHSRGAANGGDPGRGDGSGA